MWHLVSVGSIGSIGSIQDKRILLFRIDPNDPIDPIDAKFHITEILTKLVFSIWGIQLLKEFMGSVGIIKNVFIMSQGDYQGALLVIQWFVV